MGKRVWLTFLVAFAMLAAACGTSDKTTEDPVEEPVAEEPAPDPEPTPEPEPEPEPALGSEERPIQVLFVPSVDTDVIVSGGEVMKAALKEATGLSFVVKVPTSYAATIEEMCASPEDTMGFIPGFGYVIASQLCGVDVSFSAVRFGWGVYWSQILVPRDSAIETIEDLDGLRWARPDVTSTSGSLVPSVQLADAGVTPSEILDAGGHTAAALAVYRGDADFATTFFSPPLLPEGAWAPGDDPGIPDEFVESCARNDEGRLFCGPDDAYRVLDARASAAEDAPDIIQKVRILAISSEIPNDTLSFGPDFPAELRTTIENALVAFAAECDDNEDCLWNQSIGNQDFYGWTGLAPSVDADFDGMRKVVELAGIQLEDL